MRRDTLDVRHGRARGRQHVEDLRQETAPRNGEAVRRHVPGGDAVAQRRVPLQGLLDLAGQRTPRMIAAASSNPRPAAIR